MIRTYTTLVTFGSNICYHIFIYFPHRRQQNEMKPESYRIHPLSITHHLSSSSNLVQYITVLQLLSITCQHFPTALQAPDLPPQCWQPFRASRPQDRGRLERFFLHGDDVSDDVPRRQHKDSEHPRWTSASCLDLSHIESLENTIKTSDIIWCILCFTSASWQRLKRYFDANTKAGAGQTGTCV